MRQSRQVNELSLNFVNSWITVLVIVHSHKGNISCKMGVTSTSSVHVCLIKGRVWPKVWFLGENIPPPSTFRRLEGKGSLHQGDFQSENAWILSQKLGDSISTRTGNELKFPRIQGQSLPCKKYYQTF
jgi:hypothetical protein